MQSNTNITLSTPKKVTVVQLVIGKDAVCYKISPDPVDGIQPRDEHGEWPNSQGPLPAEARVAFRDGLPGDKSIFPGAVVIADVGVDAQRHHNTKHSLFQREST